RIAPRREPNLLVAIGEHDIVDARPPFHRTRLAARHPIAGKGLQLQRDMLGDMSEPGPLPQPPHEAAAPAVGTAVPVQTGQHGEEPVREARNAVAWPFLQLPKVELDSDHWRVAVDVRTPIDPDLRDLQRPGQPPGGLIVGRSEEQDPIPHIYSFLSHALRAPAGGKRYESQENSTGWQRLGFRNNALI